MYYIHKVTDLHTPYSIVHHCLPIQCRRFITLAGLVTSLQYVETASGLGSVTQLL